MQHQNNLNTVGCDLIVISLDVVGGGEDVVVFDFAVVVDVLELMMVFRLI